MSVLTDYAKNAKGRTQVRLFFIRRSLGEDGFFIGGPEFEKVERVEKVLEFCRICENLCNPWLKKEPVSNEDPARNVHGISIKALFFFLDNCSTNKVKRFLVWKQ